MKALIVSGGNPPTRSLLEKYRNAELIIGADSGCDVLIKYNITPHYIIGDFDSCQSDLTELTNKGVVKYSFSSDKESTDSKLAFDLAVSHGAINIVGLGMTGTRYDHSLANFGLLKQALANNIHMEIIDKNNKIFLINESTRLCGTKGQIISFMAYGKEVKNFSILNSKYKLENYNLSVGDDRTVSNEFIDDYIDVTFEQGGIVMVIYTTA